MEDLDGIDGSAEGEAGIRAEFYDSFENKDKYTRM